MTQLRCTLLALLGLSLAACSEDKTIVSVNYSLGEGVAVKENSDTQIRLLITQGGQKLEDSFPTPLVPGEEPEVLPDGGEGTGKVAIMVPDGAFFERYELTSFAGGEAKLTAEIVRGTEVVLKAESTFDVRENGAVVAHANFKIDPPAPPPAASSGGDTSAASSAAPTDAGSSDSGAAPTSAPDAASSAAATSDAATVNDSGTAEAGTATDAAASSSDASTDGG